MRYRSRYRVGQFGGGFDPAAFPWVMWNRGSYVAPPLAGIASAGGSGSRALVSGGIDPIPGTLLNGYAPINFRRANSEILQCQLMNNAIWPLGIGCYFVLAKNTTTQTGTGIAYGDGNFFTDLADAETSFGSVSNGARGAIYTASGYNPLTVPYFTKTQWTFIQFKWDGTNMRGRTNKGAWSSTACGPAIYPNPSIPTVGRGYIVGNYDGMIMEQMISDQVPTDTYCDDLIDKYINPRYALTLS